jgi:two-component system, chemotaxis family, protein-glutamate methylesterase/glutaminase
MTIKVLIVDDSTFFRKRLIEMIEKDNELELVGEAKNGKEAVSLVSSLSPDVITMDVEMPVMNGIDAVRAIMSENPTPILMFSSLTSDGAKSTLDALDAGAMDFIPKCFDDIARRKEDAISTLTNKIKELGKSRFSRFLNKSTKPKILGQTYYPHAATVGSTKVQSSSQNKTLDRFVSSQKSGEQQMVSKLHPVSMNVDNFKGQGKYKLLAIGSSTGGPIALQTLLTGLPSNFPLPVVVVQHMPAAFTGPFAKRLDQLCGMHVVEAKDGDVIENGTVYIAPGAMQMMVEEKGNGDRFLHIVPSPEHLNYRPCVDVTFGAAAQCYKNSVLAVVLTGMGHDGEKGSSLLKSMGSTVWAQNEETCVIYGMPKAIVDSGIAMKILAIEDMASNIIAEVKNRV